MHTASWPVAVVRNPDGDRPDARFYDEYRHDVPITDVAVVMRQAMVAAEDARFYEHHGVDLKAVARAFVNNQADADRVVAAGAPEIIGRRHAEGCTETVPGPLAAGFFCDYLRRWWWSRRRSALMPMRVSTRWRGAGLPGPVGDRTAFDRCAGATAGDTRRIVGRPVFGKTGTTDDEKSASLIVSARQLPMAGFYADPDWPQTSERFQHRGGVNPAVHKALRDAMAGKPSMESRSQAG